MRKSNQVRSIRLLGETSNRIEVLIVDPSVISREGVRVLLDAETDIHVLGSCSDLASGVGLARRLAPDVIVVDPRTGGRGSNAIASLRAASPAGRIVSLIDHEKATYARVGVRAHANGYCHAPRRPPTCSGSCGGRPPRISRLRRDPACPVAWSSSHSDGDAADPRELEILQHLANGGTNKEIAEFLGISPQTVKSHLRQLFQKLGVADRTEAVAVGLRSRLVG